MLAIERILAAAAVFVAAHFAMGFINSSAGGSLLFPFATDAPGRWVFGQLNGMLGLLTPVMIGLAGIAVLAFFVAFFASLGLWVPATMWRPLVLIGVACSVALSDEGPATRPCRWHSTRAWRGSPGPPFGRLRQGDAISRA